MVRICERRTIAIQWRAEVKIMPKTATVSLRIDPETKANAERVFSSFGLTLSDAITVFLRKSVMEGGIPFDVRAPRYNHQTEAAISQARDLMSGHATAPVYASTAELAAELDS
jgi:DNA-damage-inducible protein J